MERPIRFYTSDQPDGQFYTLARLTGENLEQPVRVCPLGQLPAPDTQRPTRQQLRRELAQLLPALQECKRLMALMEPHAAQLASELVALRTQRNAYEVRRDQLFFTLGISRNAEAAND